MFILVVEIFLSLLPLSGIEPETLSGKGNSCIVKSDTQMDVTFKAQFQQVCHLDP
jgi:hypothetical protein